MSEESNDLRNIGNILLLQLNNTLLGNNRNLSETIVIQQKMLVGFNNVVSAIESLTNVFIQFSGKIGEFGNTFADMFQGSMSPFKKFGVALRDVFQQEKRSMWEGGGVDTGYTFSKFKNIPTQFQDFWNEMESLFSFLQDEGNIPFDMEFNEFLAEGLPSEFGFIDDTNTLMWENFKKDTRFKQFIPQKEPEGKFLKGISTALSALAPQMIALTLVSKAVSALLEGIIEPLDPLIDIFGAVGQILGILLIPIVNTLMDILMPLLPLLMDIVMDFLPIIEVSMLPLKMVAMYLQLAAPLLRMLAHVMGWLGTTIATLINSLVDRFDGILGRWGDKLTRFADAFQQNTTVEAPEW